MQSRSSLVHGDEASRKSVSFGVRLSPGWYIVPSVAIGLCLWLLVVYLLVSWIS